MTTVAVEIVSRHARSGVISALILTVGVAAALAAHLADAYPRNDIRVAGQTVLRTTYTPLTAGMSIRVTRIAHRVAAEQHRIPYDVQTARDSAAPRGMLRVIQPGRTGLQERLYRITLTDGVVTSKTLVGKRWIRTPLDRVIRVGTLAQIASWGTFAGREYLDVVATAYAPFCCLGVTDVTATGMKAGYGVVAVDPTVIPLGSRLYVEGYGYAIAGDTGGRIKGLRIDLGFATKREALRYGMRRTRVYVIEVKQQIFR